MVLTGQHYLGMIENQLSFLFVGARSRNGSVQYLWAMGQTGQWKPLQHPADDCRHTVADRSGHKHPLQIWLWKKTDAGLLMGYGWERAVRDRIGMIGRRRD